MVPQPRSGSFTPNPSAHPLHTNFGHHSPHPSHHGALSAGASPSTGSPTGSNSLTKIVIAQVYLLLSTIKDDPHSWDSQSESLRKVRKLIDEHGMDVFMRYFTRLVVANAAQIFPGPSSRPPSAANPGNYHVLLGEMHKISQDFSQARKIAESIETGTEDLFRDFDLSTFMEHFKLDALEKTVLALAFKLGHRVDLKTKADAILSTNFPTFVNILSQPTGKHAKLEPGFLAELIDRFIQVHPPNFNAAAKKEFQHKVRVRYDYDNAETAPSEVLAALDLIRLLGDRPPNALALYIHRTGPDFTLDEEMCLNYLRTRPPNIQLNEEQVSAGLLYSTISQTPPHNPSVLVSSLRRVLHEGFRWQDVVSYFDDVNARITSAQFLRLYNALLPVALDDSENFDIQRLWGGEWENAETQLSFVCAYLMLTPEQLDATTIPGLKPTFTMEDFTPASPTVREIATYAVKHPLVSEAALSAVFNVALHSAHASQCVEARRLFQEVVVNNLAIFVVSAFGVPKPWPAMAEDTLKSLFDNFMTNSSEAEFVGQGVWKRDKDWVKNKLLELYMYKPMNLPMIFEQAVRQNWLDELTSILNEFGLDLAAWGHGRGFIDLTQWARRNANRATEMVRALLLFLRNKADEEVQQQMKQPTNDPSQPPPPPPPRMTVPLQVRTVSALLQILEEFLPKAPVAELIDVQRKCIQGFPRLINYGEGYDDIIDANGREGNGLPPAANAKMEEHYKAMYSDSMQVRTIVEILDRYKHSRDPLEQDIFACMIHGLFDEYPHYVDYPLEALATTAVLFGGIISHKLISELPLQIGLGMILEAVRDHVPEDSMYKFGLQALIQLFGRLREWPGFCKQLLQIPGLQETEAWGKAEKVVLQHEEELGLTHANGTNISGHSSVIGNDVLTNGNLEDGSGSENRTPPFASVNVDPPPPGVTFEEPHNDAQGKIQFVLNNLTKDTLQTMFNELREILETKHQQWFASHLVEERAKMQPNYHEVYMDLVDQFQEKSLWSEVMRETYISVQRMLNSEMTMQNAAEKTYLKNLGAWLGMLTLARDKPIKHKNIAFKQLLMEGHDTKRLVIVIPFVCKVLSQGKFSSVFKPPNPWLMDIIHLLIELYHNAELKLNLKFEIEVLCKALELDHKSIAPSGEILNRVVPVEEVVDMSGPDALEHFENLSINGISAVGSGLSTHVALPSIPDLGPNITIPPTEVIQPAKLHEIVRQALTQALREIIQPVVDRSVTIAAISTQQMIHKDFATEPDENRVRNAAINMVKSTAGSLALVTSKEPLRANFANYLRQISSLSPDLPHGLPEGIIMLCVSSNLDLASGVIEKSAEERAVPEIEDMIEGEMEARRRHRLQRPSEPYIDPGLSRWAMTIPNPFKMTPGPGGLNAEQMAIYDDFARQPRVTATSSTPSHVPSASDARSLANEVLGDQYNAVPGIPTPAETPAMPHIGVQLPYHAAQGHNGIPNGRQTGLNQLDARSLADRVNKLLEQLTTAAGNAQEDNFPDLPRAHAVLDIIDALVQLIIKTQQTSEEFASYAANQIVQLLFRQPESKLLVLQSLVHVLDALRKIAGPGSSQQIRNLFHQHPGEHFLNLNLIRALIPTDLLDWRAIDTAMAKALHERKEGSIEFLDKLLDAALLNDNPLALYADFVQSLEAAWAWITEDPNVPSGQQFKAKVMGSPSPADSKQQSPEEAARSQQEQMDYVFDEWVHLCCNHFASERAATIFIQQMRNWRIITSKEDFFLFTRRAIDRSVDAFEQAIHAGEGWTEGYRFIEALVRMIVIFLKSHEDENDGKSARTAFMDSILALGVLVLNNHHVTRDEAFNQRVFFRFFALLLQEIGLLAEDFPEVDRNRILLRFATRLYDLRPAVYPGFTFGWTALVAHRAFMPSMLRMADNAGWAPFTNLLRHLLSYLGDLVKPFEISTLGKELYQTVLKLLVVLHHDFPDYLVANHVQLCESLPPHATQLINMILAATPVSLSKVADPFQAGLKIDRIPDMREAPPRTQDYVDDLRQVGLLEILEHILRDGPSEDAIAQISHAINRPEGASTTFGYVSVSVNRRIIDAVVAFIGNFAVNRPGAKTDSPGFIPGSSDSKTLHLLATELGPEARYYLLSSMINELRFANAHTLYFSQVLIDLFTHDLSDPEETEVRQQIIRILLERVVSFWPQPWGLMITIIELIKNDKCVFFELPFIKAAPEVAERFSTILTSAGVTV